MAATVSQVSTGIKNRLATISGLRAFDYQPDMVNPPVAFPVLNSIEYHRAFGGGDVVMSYTVTVMVGRVSDRTAFSALDGYLSYSGASSIRAALEADTTLGGVTQTLVVSQAANIRNINIGDQDFLAIEVSVIVHG